MALLDQFRECFKGSRGRPRVDVASSHAVALQAKTTLLVIREFRLELTQRSKATRSGCHRLQVSSTTAPLCGGRAEPQNEEPKDAGFGACHERGRVPSAA